jgi:hypothetical protein
MAIRSQLGDGRIFQSFAGFSENAPHIIERLKKDGVIVHEFPEFVPATGSMPPVVRYPQDAPKGPPKYDRHFTLKVHGIPSIKSYLDAALSELRALRSSIGHVSGKEVRRLISKIKRARKPILCRVPSERVLIELVTQFMNRKNPNKIARLIRRAVARKVG